MRRRLAKVAHHEKMAERAGPRRPYRKPEFRHERIFETMALRCGKIHPRQGQCRRVLKKS